MIHSVGCLTTVVPDGAVDKATGRLVLPVRRTRASRARQAFRSGRGAPPVFYRGLALHLAK